ncbi:hypothetical protein MJ579_13260 [Klebsiella pneumoniae]|nr:hypothetical protein MJ579_13260 [Klebsiella pneumoniae]
MLPQRRCGDAYGKHVIEAVVDLQNKKPFLDADRAHGMVLLDDFAAEHHQYQQREFAEVLKKARYYRSRKGSPPRSPLAF